MGKELTYQITNNKGNKSVIDKNYDEIDWHRKPAKAKEYWVCPYCKTTSVDYPKFLGNNCPACDHQVLVVTMHMSDYLFRKSLDIKLDNKK